MPGHTTSAADEVFVMTDADADAKGTVSSITFSGFVRPSRVEWSVVRLQYAHEDVVDNRVESGSSSLIQW